MSGTTRESSASQFVSLWMSFSVTGIVSITVISNILISSSLSSGVCPAVDETTHHNLHVVYSHDTRSDARTHKGRDTSAVVALPL